MGILKHADVFTHKWITAIIKDSSGRGHIRHIEHVIGEYWVTDIDKQTYCFKIEDSRIITYKETAARSCRILFYSTKHYLPISPEDNKAIEETLRINNLPRMNMMMFGSFKILSQREKQNSGNPFKDHSIEEIVESVSKSAGTKFAIQAQNLKTYFDNMAIYKIVTPVREIAEFVEDDLISTDPKYLGDIYQTIQRLDFAHKKVTNKKVDAKKPWIMVIAIMMIVGVVAFGGYYLLSQGGFSLPGIPSLIPNGSTGSAQPGGKMTDAQVFAKYPTPEALHNAIQNGDISMNDLSPKVQAMEKAYKPSPIQQSH